MVFSYGFVDEDKGGAEWLALDVSTPTDDPLGRAKEAVLKSAPTLKLDDLGSTVEWTSHFIWFVSAFKFSVSAWLVKQLHELSQSCAFLLI